MIRSINSYSPKSTLCQNQKVASKPQNVTFAGTNWNKTDDFFLKIANSNPMQKIVEWASQKTTKTNRKGELIVNKNSDKLAQYLMIGFSAILQTNHIVNILRNHQMPQERKETLAVNNGLAFILPTLGALTIDNSINKSSDRFEKYIKEINNHKLSKDAIKGIKAAKTLFIFTMMYKYASTIITTPLADVTTDFMRDKGLIGKAKTKKEIKK